jgi:hypothetical protein
MNEISVYYSLLNLSGMLARTARESLNFVFFLTGMVSIDWGGNTNLYIYCKAT